VAGQTIAHRKGPGVDQVGSPFSVRSMSALGQKRTLTCAQSTSALPPKADIAGKARLSPQSREYSLQSHRALYQATLDHRQFAHSRHR
jgi:hypothetical protein